MYDDDDAVFFFSEANGATYIYIYYMFIHVYMYMFIYVYIYQLTEFYVFL